MKRIPSGAQERYRLLVSDGQWSSSFAMLATQLNSKVADGEVTDNCVIRMNRYVCNTVQENKKVRILFYIPVPSYCNKFLQLSVVLHSPVVSVLTLRNVQIISNFRIVSNT